MTTAGVLLAAGGGSRYSGPTHKLLAPFRGETVLYWSARALCDAGLDAVAIVVGATDLSSEIPTAMAIIANLEWAEGQATSLALAIDFAVTHGHDAIVIGLADQPLVPSSAWRSVAAVKASPITTARFQGERRPPVRLSRDVWPLLPRKGDVGARGLMREHPELVTVVDCEGDPLDIDTVADLIDNG